MTHAEPAARYASALALGVLIAAFVACAPGPDSSVVAGEADHAYEDHDEHDADGDHDEMPGGISIPAAVRDNLGITFAPVELRKVAATRRLPGEFELRPGGRQEYRALLAGRLTLHTEQFASVEAGQLLVTIDSPQWRQMQHEVVEAEGEIAMAEAALAVTQAQLAEAQAMLAQQETRIQNLAAVNMRKADLEAEANASRSSIPRLAAQVQGREAALREAHEHYLSRLKILASVAGMSTDALQQREDDSPAWRTLAALEVRAERPGVVESLPVSNGGWVEEGDLTLTTMDPAAIRFHARSPQADIALLEDGMRATIVPPLGGSVDMGETMTATLALGLTVNETDRTLSVFAVPERRASWARAGVGGFLEVSTGRDVPERLAIPVAAVIQDGLEHIFFRRDPDNPNRAMRAVADMGASDGRWVELRSGVREGDEVVLDGVYALKLSGDVQQAPDGYHYHADGSLHRDH